MREVFGFLVIAVCVQHYIATYNLFCVGQVVNTGQVYNGLRRAAGRKFFDKKWNRQSIERDEYRFRGILREAELCFLGILLLHHGFNTRRYVRFRVFQTNFATLLATVNPQPSPECRYPAFL